MFSNYLSFLKFLAYLKNFECEDNPYFQEVTDISEDKHGNSLVESDELMLNFENIRNDVFSNQKVIPSTVDALYLDLIRNT